MVAIMVMVTVIVFKFHHFIDIPRHFSSHFFPVQTRKCVVNASIYAGHADCIRQVIQGIIGKGGPAPEIVSVIGKSILLPIVFRVRVLNHPSTNCSLSTPRRLLVLVVQSNCPICKRYKLPFW